MSDASTAAAPAGRLTPLATKIACTRDVGEEPQSVEPKRRYVLRKNCLSLAEKLARGGKKCVVLAPANNRAPGGPDGEEMFGRTDLLETLGTELYPIDSAELSRASLLYSEKVTVLKDASGQAVASPFEIGVISCAAVAHASTKQRDGGGRTFRHPRDASITEVKMCGVLEAAARAGADALIINAAWGRGPLEGIVDLWRKAFSSSKSPPYVVFAVVPRDGENADDVAEAFGALAA